MLAIYTGLRQAIEKNPAAYKLCEQCSLKLSERRGTSSTDMSDKQMLKIDKTKTVYDEAEIDYINDN